ncbi:MAG: PTS sugar transporter subunit IIB [Eubacteriales bacterium]|nr:PTS sugar transporter subunit IIB [Eubacteriales bacterium]
MDELFILLACGSGASSGFMAANIKKAIKEKGLSATVKAVSDSEIEEYADEIDILLIGPHISYLEDDLNELAEEKGFPLMIIPQSIYGTLNGKETLELVLQKLGKE